MLTKEEAPALKSTPSSLTLWSDETKVVVSLFALISSYVCLCIAPIQLISSNIASTLGSLLAQEKLIKVTKILMWKLQSGSLLLLLNWDITYDGGYSEIWTMP